MSRNKNEIAVQPAVSVFTEVDKEEFKSLKEAIYESQRSAEGLAETIACSLAQIAEKKLYLLEDYEDIYKFAKDTFDIARGTVSDAISVFKRFGSEETGLIEYKYSQYKFSTLMRMKNYTDEELKEAGITPDMSRAKVIEAIETIKENRELSKRLPAIESEFKNCIDKLGEILESKEDITRKIEELIPKYFEEGYNATALELDNAVDVLSGEIECIQEDLRTQVRKYSEAITRMTSREDMLNEFSSVVPDFEDRSIEDLKLNELSAIIVNADINHGSAELAEYIENNMKDIDFTPAGVFYESNEDEGSNDDEESNEPEAMPVIDIDIEKYVKAGKVSKGKLLADIYTLIEKEVSSGNAEIHIFSSKER